MATGLDYEMPVEIMLLKICRGGEAIRGRLHLLGRSLWNLSAADEFITRGPNIIT